MVSSLAQPSLVQICSLTRFAENCIYSLTGDIHLLKAKVRLVLFLQKSQVTTYTRIDSVCSSREIAQIIAHGRYTCSTYAEFKHRSSMTRTG